MQTQFEFENAPVEIVKPADDDRKIWRTLIQIPDDQTLPSSTG